MNSGDMVTSRHYILCELLAEAKAAGVYPLSEEEREWIDAPAVGRELPVDHDVCD
ncbi:MAG: hypothetical protein WBF88_18710 [Pusillimonas sp.]